MIEGFKKFIARGNMIDMAVGVVMGGAVTTVVNSIVNNVINPFIAMIFGKPNMDGLLAITFNNATVSFGAVLGAILNFLIIAAAVYFCILVPSRRSCCCSKSATNLPNGMHRMRRTCRTIPTLLPVQSQCGSHRQQSEVSSAIVIINNPRPSQAVTQAPPETAFRNGLSAG